MKWNKFPDVLPPEDKTVVFLLKTIICYGWLKDGADVYGYVRSTGYWSSKKGVSVDCFNKRTPEDTVLIADMTVLYWCPLLSNPVELPVLRSDGDADNVETLLFAVKKLKEQYKDELDWIERNCVQRSIRRLWNEWPCDKASLDIALKNDKE